jgi:hypothetical protein
MSVNITAPIDMEKWITSLNSSGIVFTDGTSYSNSTTLNISPYKQLISVFGLDITEEQGNCQFCYKKSDKKLAKLANKTPEIFNFIKEMESKYPEPNTFIFRGHKSVQDILDLEYTEELSTLEDCAEECGTVYI